MCSRCRSAGDMTQGSTHWPSFAHLHFPGFLVAWLTSQVHCVLLLSCLLTQRLASACDAVRCKPKTGFSAHPTANAIQLPTSRAPSQVVHSCRSEIWSAIDNGLQRRDQAAPVPRGTCLARRNSILPRPPRVGDLLAVRIWLLYTLSCS